MSGFFVALSSIDDVKHFVDAASRCPCEVDVLSGRYVINAKSIMGLIQDPGEIKPGSLDLSQPVQVEVNGTDAQRGAFQADVAAFRVDAGQ